MGKAIVTETCVHHEMHSGTYELNDFGEATGLAMQVIANFAETDEMVYLIRQWVDKETEPVAALNFVSWKGQEVFITYMA